MIVAKGDGMRYLKLALAFLCFAGALWAADSYVGTWKLNPAKSTYTTGQGPKDQTIRVKRQGSDYDITVSFTFTDGSTSATHYIVPVSGGNGKILESGTDDAIKCRRVDDRTRENTFYRQGKEIRTTRSTLAKDGRTMEVRVKGQDAKGSPVDATLAFDKEP